MKKTFCDRCGAECDGENIQRFTIFDVNKSIDVCDNCYQAFFQWLQSGKNVESGDGCQNCENGPDDFFDTCADCEYCKKGTWEYPCCDCRHGCEGAEKSHYKRREKTDEN